MTGSDFKVQIARKEQIDADELLWRYNQSERDFINSKANLNGAIDSQWCEPL